MTLAEVYDGLARHRRHRLRGYTGSFPNSRGKDPLYHLTLLRG